MPQPVECPGFYRTTASKQACPNGLGVVASLRHQKCPQPPSRPRHCQGAPARRTLPRPGSAVRMSAALWVVRFWSFLEVGVPCFEVFLTGTVCYLLRGLELFSEMPDCEAANTRQPQHRFGENGREGDVGLSCALSLGFEAMAPERQGRWKRQGQRKRLTWHTAQQKNMSLYDC